MRLTRVTNKANMVLMNTTNNIAEVLERNELGLFGVEHARISGPSSVMPGGREARRVLETVARLLDKADEYEDNDAVAMAARCREDARVILAEVLR